MENAIKSNTLNENREKLTLMGYYKSLSKPTSPKRELLEKIAIKCGVTIGTARNWVKYGMKPSNHEHYAILSEITGIPERDLFD